MSALNDLQSSFSKKLDERVADHAARLDAELRQLREHLLHPGGGARYPGAAPVPGMPRPLSLPQPQPTQERVDLGRVSHLKELDAAFVAAFNLDDYYSVYKLDYPTVYCETLEEFLLPLVERMEISPQARQAALQAKAEDARQQAEKTHGGGIFGYNLPAEGCYLNGWLFAWGQDKTPQALLRDPQTMPHILGTAVHEKLGHGFIGLYSALGAVKTSLGLHQADIVRRFELRIVDDPVSSLRREQANLLFKFSQLLEEGWATWLETFTGHELLQTGSHPRHHIQAVQKAMKNLPASVPDREDLLEVLMDALQVLFGPEPAALDDLHQAVLVLDIFGAELDSHFGATLGQPLRYAAGELLLTRGEENLGVPCMPYVVLIAANVSFSPDRISLSDLAALLRKDHRLNPDARLAALCQLHLEQKGSVAELAQRAESELSFSIPQELKGYS